jgi:hypothetical protein
MNVRDALQANLGFVELQTSHIETGVYRNAYPDVQYPGLIPVDTSANPWVTTVTYYSMDRAGVANWINGKAYDIPLVGVALNQFQTTVHMAGVGYDYGLEEVNQARMLGLNLPGEKASTAKRASEEFIDQIALVGDTAKGFEGLFSSTAVTAGTAPNGASPVSPLWAGKTGLEIINDVNTVLSGVYTDTNTTRSADTLLLPYSRFNQIAIKPMFTTDNPMTVLAYIRLNNIYTAQTGQPLDIRGLRQLDTRGAGSTARIIAYRKSPEVLKLHMPMPHQFLPVQLEGLTYVIPGIFRLGGLDIRLPKEIRYLDGV